MNELIINLWRIAWFLIFSIPAMIWAWGILLTNAPSEDTERYIKKLLWCWSFGRSEYDKQ